MENISTNHSDYFISMYIPSRSVRFYVYLTLNILSLICVLFVLYNLLRKRNSREAIHNHPIIVILILVFLYEILDIPIQLYYFYTGNVYLFVPLFCQLWLFIDYGFYYTIAILLLYVSIQRHIIIFHSNLMNTKRKRIIFHYFPLLSVILLMMLFYILANFVLFNECTFDVTSNLCGGLPCYFTIPFFMLIEQIGFCTVTTILILIFNFLLVLRVILQKHRIFHSSQWKKQRKLITQAIFISLLYLIFQIPSTILYFIFHFFENYPWLYDVYNILTFLTYFIIFLLPFVCLTTLPKCNYTKSQTHPR